MSDEVEEQIQQLGSISHIVRLTSGHGCDDPYYVSKYNTKVIAFAKYALGIHNPTNRFPVSQTVPSCFFAWAHKDPRCDWLFYLQIWASSAAKWNPKHETNEPLKVTAIPLSSSSCLLNSTFSAACCEQPLGRVTLTTCMNTRSARQIHGPLHALEAWRGIVNFGP